MKKQYLFLILVIYLIGCIMNLCYYIVIYGTFFSMQYSVAKLLQKSEMRKDIVIELSYKGFG